MTRMAPSETSVYRHRVHWCGHDRHDGPALRPHNHNNDEKITKNEESRELLEVKAPLI